MRIAGIQQQKFGMPLITDNEGFKKTSNYLVNDKKRDYMQINDAVRYLNRHVLNGKTDVAIIHDCYAGEIDGVKGQVVEGVMRVGAYPYADKTGAFQFHIWEEAPVYSMMMSFKDLAQKLKKTRESDLELSQRDKEALLKHTKLL